METDEIKNRIIDYIILGTGGRLIAFKPENQIGVADIIIKRKGGYKDGDKNSLLKTNDSIVRAKIFGSKKRITDDELNIFVNIMPFGTEKEFKLNPVKVAFNKNSYLVSISFDAVKNDIGEDVRIMRLDESKKEFNLKKKDLSAFFLELL